MTHTRTILFGANPTEGITAVEVGESEAVLYIRSASGELTETREPFTPWLIVSRAEDIPHGGEAVELAEDGYRYLVKLPTWSAFVSARNALRTKGTDHLAYPGPQRQFLLSTGKTLFKGLAFDGVHQMQIDIETAGLSSESESGRIFLIAISDNRGYEELIEGEESEILSKLVSVVRERNPDVLAGHNIFGFDLPFLAARAKRCGVTLALGRDGSQLAFGSERSCPIGGHSRPFVPAFVYGRHVIDTLLAVQRFDVAKGQLERYSLKESAHALGLSEPDRVLIPGDRIAEMWATDPETVKVYARQDVRETGKLAALVCPAEFHLTQMVPDTYQNSATSGTGEKINSILIREYLRQGHAIPRPEPAKPVPGGYTEIRASGLIHNVVKCDVESLYPSLMLNQEIKPKSDVLGIFLPALAELTDRRIDAKSRAKSVPEAERAYWDSLQNSFKILINSFYGYLGAPFNFNDFDAAEQVTTSGQEIVKQIADSIERRSGRIIEIDTDGVYFQSPPDITNQAAEEALVEEIGLELPEGIRLAHDGRYAAMLSLKVKNYVLVDYDGRKTFKGAAVRSRADEPFGREFISQAVDLLLKGDREGVRNLYRDLAERIRKGGLSVEQFARRERITSKTFNSAQKKRTAAIAKGIGVGDYITVYEKINGELGLIEEYAGDEDRDYLLDKLYKFACRLREAFGEDFDLLFPAPGRRPLSAKAAEAAGQQKLDLF
jgi:DNA polymerase elongation subunit (family B)